MLFEEYTDSVVEEKMCPRSVLDVAPLLRANYAFVTGGKAKNGAPVMTFPEVRKFTDITDDNYRKLVSYISNVPDLHEIEMGFVIVLDRREENWKAVKATLSRISCFFPKSILMVLVLKPQRLFQKAFSDLKVKFIKEFEFKVVLCNGMNDIFEYINPDQLTTDIGGEIEYDASEWIKHRANVENFMNHTETISTNVKENIDNFRETELVFPNDVESMQSLIKSHSLTQQYLLDSITSADNTGQLLLKGMKGDNQETPIIHRLNILILERLLVQLDETMENTQAFWEQHKGRLNECLQLRQFEKEVVLFRDKTERRIEWLNDKMYVTGENAKQADNLIQELENFAQDWQEDIEQGKTVLRRGRKLSENGHFAGDSIRHRSMEIQCVCDKYKDVRNRRREILDISRVLHQEVENARKWCEEGKYMLANQKLDSCKSVESAGEAIETIETFLKTSSQLEIDTSEEIQQLFKGMTILNNIKEVLQTVEDVRDMCENRKEQIQKFVVNNNKLPVQIVRGQQKPSAHTGIDIDPPTEIQHLFEPDSDINNHKRKCVIQELLETEKIYVADLEDVLKGYCYKLNERDMEGIVPKELVDKKEILFGNMEEIYDFHNRTFLPELQNCKHLPSEIGKCFINRVKEFCNLYGIYCQNKIKSEAIYKQVGENNPFFLECKRQLDETLNANKQRSEVQMQPIATTTLPLGSYLLKPIQRITKYHLFLSDMVKFTEDDSDCKCLLQKAFDEILEVLRCVNDSMHQINIVGFPSNLSDQGRLLIRDEFIVSVYHRKQKLAELRVKQKPRHIFLYEHSILFCKKKVDQQQRPYYAFKSSLKITQVGLTENIKGDERKFELWSGSREDVYLIQVSNQQIKEKWLKEIKKCLQHKFDHIKVLI